MVNPQQPGPVQNPDLDSFRDWVRKPVNPVPDAAMELLFEAACQDSGGGQAARSFLFWLAGEPDPTCFRGQGGLELRRMDDSLRQAATEILRWWIGPTQSDEALHTVLRNLSARFASHHVQPNAERNL